LNILHKKNSFTEVSKIITGYRLENLLRQNNYVGNSNMISNTAKNFDILVTSLSVLHNFFESNKISFRFVFS